MHPAANLLGAALAFGASTSLGSAGAAEEWLQLIDRFGAMAVILLYMLLKDWITWKANAKRYDQLEKRMNAKDQFIQDKLMQALVESTQVAHDTKTFIESVKQTMDLCPQEVLNVYTTTAIRPAASVRETGTGSSVERAQCRSEHG